MIGTKSYQMVPGVRVECGNHVSAAKRRVYACVAVSQNIAGMITLVDFKVVIFPQPVNVNNHTNLLASGGVLRNGPTAV